MASDWIDTFLTLTEGLRSPRIFRLWAGISTIAGALQRRVYTELEAGTCYTNLYVLLTGVPGTGKSVAIAEVRKLWASLGREMYIGPDNPTKPALFERLANAMRIVKMDSGETNIFSSLAVPCEEFGVLITKFDNEFLATLSHIWNNPPVIDAPRVTKEDYIVEKPNMTIVAGVQPDTLGMTFPELAWGQGFTSRLVFIFSEEVEFNNANFFRKRREATSSPELVAPLREMFDLNGEVEWTQEAMNAHIAWLDAGQPTAPTHSRLKFYNVRRNEHMVKLAMIAAVSAGRGLLVTLPDLLRAREWLFEAERYMPDVFRAMAQKSDQQTIADLHYAMFTYWARKAPNPVPLEDELLVNWLKDRVTSERIAKVIEIAERGGWFRRAPGSNGARPRWIPRPLDEVTMKLN